MPAMPAEGSNGAGRLVPGWRRTRLGAALFKAVHHSALVLEQRVEGTSTVGTLARLWMWQLWRRTARRPALIRCADGSLLLAPSWSRVGAVIAGTGLTERDDAIFVLDLLRPGDLFIDVGANIGFYTVLAARRGASVEAFEPTPLAAATCERVVALNGVQELVRIHQVACGAVSGTSRFTTGLDISNHVVEADRPGIDVEMTTLDEQLAGREVAMSMFKVDAEKHDLEVLQGALATIERLRPVILVEIWSGGARPLQLVDRFGYRPYVYDRHTRELSEIEPGHHRGGNILLIADANVQAVRERVQAAERPPLRPPSVSWTGRRAPAA
jgi:FkbM family methyltransferase